MVLAWAHSASYQPEFRDQLFMTVSKSFGLKVSIPSTKDGGSDNVF
jgi:hypothetical protein